MSPELKIAFFLSVGTHVAFLSSLAINHAQPSFDVKHGPNSLELVVLAPPLVPEMLQEIPVQEEIEAPVEETLPEEPEQYAQVVEESISEPIETLQTIAHQGVLSETPVGYLRNPPPVYPRLARVRGYEGTALLHVEVLKSGKAGRIELRSSSGHDILDRQAVKALKRWRFHPSRRGDLTITSWVEIPVTFQLRQ